MAWRLWPPWPGTRTPAAPARVEGTRAAGRDWASLPSIQRSFGATRLTAESVTFARSLTGRRPLEVAIAQLGHQRSPEAPAGLLVARAQEPPSRPGAPTLLELLRPWSRSPRTAVQRAPGEVEAPTEPELSGGTTTRFETEPSTAEAPVALPPTGLVPVPERVEPAASSLTRALDVDLEVDVKPAAVRPPLEPAPVEAPPAAPSSETAPAGPRLNLGQSRRLGLGPRPSTELPLAQRRSIDVETGTGGEAPLHQNPTPPELPAPVPGPAEPRASGEDSAPQRATGDGGAARLDDQSPPGGTALPASPAPAQVQYAAGPVEVAPPPPEPPVQRPAPAPAVPPGGRMTNPILRVQRRVTGRHSEPMGEVTITATGGRAEAGQRPAGPPPTAAATPDPSRSVAPGPARPLVSRATAAGSPPEPAGELTPPTAGEQSGVVSASSGPPDLGMAHPFLFRAAPAPAAATDSAATDAAPETAGTPAPDEPSSPVLRIAAGGPSAPRSLEPPRELTGSRPPPLLSTLGPRSALAIQRQRLDRPAAEQAPVALSGPVAARWHEGGSPPAVPMPMPQRRTPFSVQALGRAVPPEPPLSAVAPMPLPRPEPMAAPATVVQPFGGLGAPPLAAVESELGSARHAAESTLGELGSTGQAAGARGAQALDGAAQAVHYAVGGGAGGAGLPSSDKDVEELAGRLYDRIRSRLRSDLLIGRERAGRITDLR